MKVCNINRILTSSTKVGNEAIICNKLCVGNILQYAINMASLKYGAGFRVGDRMSENKVRLRIQCYFVSKLSVSVSVPVMFLCPNFTVVV